MMVKMSPLLNGRSCSEVPLKLYLATHSVPWGHGLCNNEGGSHFMRRNKKQNWNIHIWHHPPTAGTLEVELTWTSVMVRWSDSLTGEVFSLLPLELVNTPTHRVPTEKRKKIWVTCFCFRKTTTPFLGRYTCSYRKQNNPVFFFYSHFHN